MKQKLMIVGAGEFQVPIISQAKQMDLFTIAVSIARNYPGFEIADKSYAVDVREKEKVLEIAGHENISGILTDQTDMSVPTVAYVAENMGLPGITYDCALRFTNKYLMRLCCEKSGIKTPRFFQARTLKEASITAGQLQLPFILKPVDCQGSRGVSKVNHPDELREKFNNARSFSKQGAVILEEFFQGREIVIEGFAFDYDFANLIIGDSYNFELADIFIPKQRFFPSSLNKSLKQKLLNLNSQLIKGLGLKFGITHSEYLVDEDTGEICLMEVAARGGGVFISSHLIPLGCGIDVNELLIKTAMGQAISFDPNDINEKASGYVCFYLPEGKIRSVQGIDLVNSLPGVHNAYLDNLVVGRQSAKMMDKTMRFGPILLAGNNRQSLQETIQKLPETLTVEVETQEGIRGIIW
jgi:biotin carboxylase